MAYLTTYQVCEIARDTYVINEAGMAAMFLVIGEERALLIDTGAVSYTHLDVYKRQ